ncbi:MAG: hypothetical protein JXB88_09570 [Spirochaetales bacterium]|nr:hypothetical protein [Spirochaetales bacterium]
MSDNVAEVPESSANTEPVKSKQSSAVLNILMIIIGLFFLSKGILELLTWLKIIPIPDWLKTVYSKLNDKDLTSALSFLGTQGIITATLGFWSFVGGILLFSEQESGWGMAVVILSTIVIMGAASIINWIMNPSSFELLYWPNWITIITAVIGFFGFFYLLLTKKRYN